MSDVEIPEQIADTSGEREDIRTPRQRRADELTEILHTHLKSMGGHLRARINMAGSTSIDIEVSNKERGVPKKKGPENLTLDLFHLAQKILDETRASVGIVVERMTEPATVSRNESGVMELSPAEFQRIFEMTVEDSKSANEDI